MRNLKRALSLTLASVMLLGMMVVGAGAASYPDVSEEDNIEAIEVLQAVKVMVGDENGNFGPEQPVNRSQMAVVMALLLDLNYDYYQGTCPFWDVPSWAEPYVAACYANGIVSGYNAYEYGAADPVTAVQAASMMMRALGYFKFASDYADGFELSTVRQASKINLFDQIGANATDPLTRNQVAQLALNTLQTPIVEAQDNTFNITSSTGDTSITASGGQVTYTVVASTQAFAQAIDNTEYQSNDQAGRGGCTVELGEQLYNGKLKLYKYTDDIFFRPARTWEFDGKEVGAYMKKENIRETYIEGVTYRELYDLLGRNNLLEYAVTYYVDGVLDTSIDQASILSRSTSNAGKTGRGVLTQVFVDTEAKSVDIASINTFLAKANADYNKTNERVTLEVYRGVTSAGSPVVITTDTTSKTVSSADVTGIENIKQDDFVLVNVSGKDSSSTNAASLSGYDVKIVTPAEVLTDCTLSKFSKNSDSDSSSNNNEALFKSVVTGGSEYKSAAKAYYSDEVLDLYDNSLLVNKTYNIYLDPYGNAIGVDLYAGDANYVFITGVDLNTSSISLGSAKAAAIFTDGTMQTIDVNVSDTNKNIAKVDADGSDSVAGSYFEQWKIEGGGAAETNINDKTFAINRWYTYTVDASNEYTLNPATRMFTTEVLNTASELDQTIKCNSVRIDENASFADDTGTPPSLSPPSAEASPANDGVNRAAAGKGALGNGVRAYGNDDSIFIVVEAEESVSTSSDNVITGVAGVYTGVQNVEIKVNTTGKDGTDDKVDDTELYDQIYTLYDKNYFIIASVILGEAKGDDANYAYILTAGTSEELLSDGTHQWEFDAIVDGVKTTLTARSKFTKTIFGLEPGHVQELRFNGDYVVGVVTPDAGAKAADGTNYEKYYIDPTAGKIDGQDIYDVGHVANYSSSSTHVGRDCVKSSHSVDMAGKGVPTSSRITTAAAPDLRFDGRTLYLKPEGTAGDYGLAFVKDAQAAVIQKTDGSTKVLADGMTVGDAISLLGDPDESTPALEFQGRIVAILNSQGVAKWVVFISDTEVNSTGINLNTNYTIKVNRILSSTDGTQKYDTQTLTKTSAGPWYIDVLAEVGDITGYTPMVNIIPVTEDNRVEGVSRTYSIDVTYTKKAPVPYTVTFDKNGAAGTDPAAATESSAGAGVTLPNSTGMTAPTGMVFAGWAESDDDTTATAGAAGAVYRPSEDCTLYAVWRLPKVTLDANGGTLTDNELVPDAAGGNVTIPAGTAVTAPSKKIFKEWNSKADGSGTTQAAGTYTPTADITFYAIWDNLYTVSFDANGGTGTVNSVTQTAAGGNVTIPDSTGLTPPDAKTFKEWNTASDGNGSAVTGTYKPTQDVTLFAIWQ